MPHVIHKRQMFVSITWEERAAAYDPEGAFYSAAEHQGALQNALKAGMNDSWVYNVEVLMLTDQGPVS
jgi:hypothetical protein